MANNIGGPFAKKTYYGITLDPLHVGTGGYRLGRVDNTITREPGTNLPKVPGSSIAGVARAYTAMSVQSDNSDQPELTAEGWAINYERYSRWRYQRPDYKFFKNGEVIRRAGEGKALIAPLNDTPAINRDLKGNEIYFSCAGKGGEDGDNHCGQPDCEVCIPYGFSRKSGSSFQGLAQFFDARILFFPVYSMKGPVWITSKPALEEFKEAIKTQTEITFELEADLNIPESYGMLTNQTDADANLNLGWLYLKNAKKVKPIRQHNLALDGYMKDRLVLVSEALFSHLVNDNLEVRTSVAIDPATGAAVEHALYTYEAIPRKTVLWFDVVYNKPEYFMVSVNGHKEHVKHDKAPGEGWTWVRDNVEKGLAFLEHLGTGGMNTRGMGRFRVLNLERVRA